MKKQRDAKKLNLQSEQIRELTPAKFDQVVGGRASNGDGGSGPSTHTHKGGGG